MRYILASNTEPDILDTIHFVATVRGSYQVVVAESETDILQQAQRDTPSLAVWDLDLNERPVSQYLDQWYASSTLWPVPLLLLTNGKPKNICALPSPVPKRTTCVEKPVDLLKLGLHVGSLLDSGNGSSTPPAGHQRQVGDLVLDYQMFHVDVDDETISLTPTEFKLLRHFMENPGQTFSSEQLLDDVWKYPPGVGSPDVVRMYVKRLRDKIEPDSGNPQHIVTISGHGYQLPAPESSDQPVGDVLPVQQQEAAQQPARAIDGDTLQGIAVALQTVTLTCQATLATMTCLVDQLSHDGGGRQLNRSAAALPSPVNGGPDNHHLEPAGGRRSKFVNGCKTIPSEGRFLADCARGVSAAHQPGGRGSPGERGSPADKIAVAADSLSELAGELQTTLTQIQADWPGIDSPSLAPWNGTSE